MAKVRAIVVGTGGFARGCYIRPILNKGLNTKLVGFVEPGEAARDEVRKLFAEAGKECPPFYETVKALVKARGAADAAAICSPHKFHLPNATDCISAGMDVCIEKPMVLNAAEARKLMRLRDKTGRTVVVGFPGSLSGAHHKAKQMLADGVIGDVSSIAAWACQAWAHITTGMWRQVPEISGGGFLFDTGSHMINSVVDLMGADVERVMAIFDNRGTPVEINSSVSGRFSNGVMFSLAGAGDSIQCFSEILVYGTEGVLRTGIWGEKLELKRRKDREFKPVPHRKTRGTWAQFLRVRAGKLENPCPPKVGLRFAKLMDMIRESDRTGRAVVARTTAKKKR